MPEGPGSLVAYIENLSFKNTYISGKLGCTPKFAFDTLECHDT